MTWDGSERRGPERRRDDDFNKKFQTLENSNQLVAQELNYLRISIVPIIEQHREILHGKYPEPGLIAEVSTLKTEKKNREWHLRALWTSMLGLGSALMAKIFVFK